MFRTALCLLVASTANCMVEVDKTRALVEQQMSDWEVALNSGDTSGLLGTFKKDARICFNGECGTGLDAFKGVLRKYDSFKIELKPGGSFAKNFAQTEWRDTIKLNGCTTVLDGTLTMYIKDGKVTEEHCFCDPNKIVELFACAGVLPTGSKDEL
eukprot:TRINITY_DN1491_c0_g2_i1.p1 TRINITY_DN1491_c0_g2~~TRINITY_DN1491_c0_g2_i1.p1  ORF type:complete len:155 (+),score=27.15 TRINITY_DN1491_c0_g2_i1:51-515(+)